MTAPDLVVVTVGEGEYSSLDPYVHVFIARREDYDVFMDKERARDAESVEEAKRLNVPWGYQSGFWESEEGRERIRGGERRDAEKRADLEDLKAKAIPSTHFEHYL